MHGLGQGLDLAISGKFCFMAAQVWAGIPNDSLTVQHDNVFFFCSKSVIEAGTGNGSRTCTGYYNFDLFYFFIRQFQCIDQCSTGDDGRSMLVIMHQGNVQFCFESIFDLKCLRGLYVFKVDTSECGGNGFYSLDKFFSVFFIDFNIKNIYVCKYFK